MDNDRQIITTNALEAGAVKSKLEVLLDQVMVRLPVVAVCVLILYGLFVLASEVIVIADRHITAIVGMLSKSCGF